MKYSMTPWEFLSLNIKPEKTEEFMQKMGWDVGDLMEFIDGRLHGDKGVSTDIQKEMLEEILGIPPELWRQGNDGRYFK